MENDGKVQIIIEIGGKISETRLQYTVRILHYTRVFLNRKNSSKIIEKNGGKNCFFYPKLVKKFE